MRWIKLTIAGVALCAAASAAEAQGPPPGAGGQGQGGGQGRGRMQAMLFEGITLTQAQQDKLEAIREKGAKERQAHMPAGGMGGPPDPAMRKMMQDMQAKQQLEMRAVLTTEQQVIFDRNVAAIKARREQRQGPPRAG